MKVFISIVSFLFVSTAMASALKCQVQESVENKSTYTNVEVQSGDNAHGTIQNFSLQKFPQISGMVALTTRDGKDFAVLNLYSSDLKVGTSSITPVNEQGTFAHLQLIVPSTGTFISAVVVDCTYSK